MVSFTHGEGFGRPLLEATATGLTVVATGWSGHIDFLDDNNQRMSQLVKNQVPFYEIISGAALAFAALLLILPGFATDIIGFLLIFPPTRKLLLKKVSNKYSNKNNKSNENNKKEDFINGEFEDIEEDKIEENKDEKL